MTTPTLPSLAPGEIYAGPVLDEEGRIKHHLVLLPARPDARLDWDAAKAWAASVGGELPNRKELALLFSNCKPHLPPGWHWSCQEDEEDASCAWGCYFGNGSQYDTHKSFEGSAVAVRRLIPESFDPFVPAPAADGAAASAAETDHALDALHAARLRRQLKEGTALFMYAPRPAIVSAEPEYAYQRRFGSSERPHDWHVSPSDAEAQALRAQATVYRDAGYDVAELTIRLGLRTRAEITVRLTPAELREVAARLIDAAHDIEAHPAAALAPEREAA